MKHLTDEQMSALLDRALAATELAACEAHLTDCDACRTRLAELSAMDESLERSLAHDPGDAYFESFADRVAARIAAAGEGATGTGVRPQTARAPASHSFWGWLVSPRGLALAGSTAALLLVAGLAWVRFQERGGTVADLRESSPSPVGSALREQAAPESVAERTVPRADDARPAPAAEAMPDPSAAPRAVAPPAGAPLAAAPPADARPDAARMQELRRNESGEYVPVRPPAPPAAPVTTSNEAPAAKAALAPTEAAVRTSTTRAEEKEQLSASAEPLAPCGTVRDSRGRAVSGAQVMVVNDVTRTSRTGPDGSFCLSRLERGDQLSVLRVGYEPVRITVGDASPLAVVMEPVGTLGPDAGKPLTLKGTPSALTRGFTMDANKALTSTPQKAGAPVPDLYATQSVAVREAVAGAREAARLARRDRAALAMDAAATRWDAIAALVAGSALHDARFQALSLRRESLGVEPNAARLSRFNDGLRLFLAEAPHDLPEYGTALRWKAQVSPADKSLYR